MKTMRDKLRSMLKDRREGNKKNVNSSGIEVAIGHMDQLFDYFILETHETEEARQSERDEANERAESLVDVGHKI